MSEDEPSAQVDEPSFHEDDIDAQRELRRLVNRAKRREYDLLPMDRAYQLVRRWNRYPYNPNVRRHSQELYFYLPEMDAWSELVWLERHGRKLPNWSHEEAQLVRLAMWRRAPSSGYGTGPTVIYVSDDLPCARILDRWCHAECINLCLEHPDTADLIARDGDVLVVEVDYCKPELWDRYHDHCRIMENERLKLGLPAGSNELQYTPLILIDDLFDVPRESWPQLPAGKEGRAWRVDKGDPEAVLAATKAAMKLSLSVSAHKPEPAKAP